MTINLATKKIAIHYIMHVPVPPIAGRALQNLADYTLLHSKLWNLCSAAKYYTDDQLLQATTAIYEFDRSLWEKSGFADGLMHSSPVWFFPFLKI